MVWKRESRRVSLASRRAGRNIFASTKLLLLGSEAAWENLGGKVAPGRVGDDAVRQPLGRQSREVVEVGLCGHDGADTGGYCGDRKVGGSQEKASAASLPSFDPWFLDVCACGSANSPRLHRGTYSVEH